MNTRLADFIKHTPEGRRAREIIGKCVHCGLCIATCPTYQLLGDELDGPRGRIYQIKAVVEGVPPTRNTQRHLDRCLTCLSCETTCPSGVRYGQLLDIGKSLVEQCVRRPWRERLLRKLLLAVLPYRHRVGPLVRLGQYLRPLLPGALKAKIPLYRAPRALPMRQHARTVLLLQGCAQPAMAPAINAASMRVLDRLGIAVTLVPGARCCGAASYHNHDRDRALQFMRASIDAWWPHVENGVEAIVVDASGCGAVIKDYGDILRDDPVYAIKAQRVAALCRDIVEIVQREDLDLLKVSTHGQTVAFHSPCTLQHAQKLPGRVESLLTKLGFDLLSVADEHLCCGSAGTYSLLQPALATKLRERKLDALQARTPALIATANMACMYHLQAGTRTRVVHWIELLDGE